MRRYEGHTKNENRPEAADKKRLVDLGRPGYCVGQVAICLSAYSFISALGAMPASSRANWQRTVDSCWTRVPVTKLLARSFVAVSGFAFQRSRLMLILSSLSLIAS